MASLATIPHYVFGRGRPFEGRRRSHSLSEDPLGSNTPTVHPYTARRRPKVDDDYDGEDVIGQRERGSWKVALDVFWEVYRQRMDLD